MKTTFHTIFVAAAIATCTLESAFARLRNIESTRSNVSLNVGEVLAENEVRLVEILLGVEDGEQRIAHFLIDKKGLATTTISQDYPLRITIWRRSEEAPYAVVVLERHKEGIETDLIDAVALDFENPRFLDANLFRQLKATHEGIPEVIADLNNELNALVKQPDEQDGNGDPTTALESKLEGNEKKPKQESDEPSQKSVHGLRR